MRITASLGRRARRTALGSSCSAGKVRRASAAVVESLEGRMLLSAATPFVDDSHRLSQSLINLYNGTGAVGGGGGVTAGAATGGPGRAVTVGGDDVYVEVGTSRVRKARRALEALGLAQVATSDHVIDGLLPIAAIPALAHVPGLVFARSTDVATTAGSANSQGDAAMRADDARPAFDVNGSGVTVGVLSDSFDNGGTGSYAADQTSGDLPAGVINRSASAVGADEGRAMLQIVHDVAPSAGLAFHTAQGGEVAYAQGIHDLVDNAGADVVVDDGFYLTEPMFQDGVVTQAIDSVVGQGVTYMSAAGNWGRQGYDESLRLATTFTDGQYSSAVGAPHFAGGQAHDFDPGAGVDVRQAVFLEPGERIWLSFQWDDSSFTASGVGADGNMDIYLMDASGTQVLAGGSSNNVNGDPVEILDYTNPNGTGTYYSIMILFHNGSAPSRIKYVDFAAPVSPAGAVWQNADKVVDFPDNADTSSGHSMASSSVAIGAAFYGNTPEFGVTPPVVEPFSARGNGTVLFDTAGNRYGTPVIRHKPNLVAPDGGNTSFFGTDITNDADSQPNFFGTSAAVPHAAGVAALMIDANPTGATPAKIYSDMSLTAIDMAAAGLDSDTGYGLIQANSAVARVLSSVSPGATMTVVGTGIADSIDFAVSGSNIVVTYNGGTFSYASNTVARFYVDAGNGNDNVNLGDDFSAVVTLLGGAGNDSLTGGLGADSLSGGDGDDVLIGSDGADTIVGGNGNDQLYGNAGSDLLDARDSASFVDLIYPGGNGATVLKDSQDQVF
jgi:hypothetical protein